MFAEKGPDVDVKPDLDLNPSAPTRPPRASSNHSIITAESFNVSTNASGNGRAFKRAMSSSQTVVDIDIATPSPKRRDHRQMSDEANIGHASIFADVKSDDDDSDAVYDLDLKTELEALLATPMSPMPTKDQDDALLDMDDSD